MNLDKSELIHKSEFIPKTYLNKFKVCKKQFYEFQDLCLELEKTYGKGVWCLPTKYTLNKIREADKICRAKHITSFSYLVGVLKKL